MISATPNFNGLKILVVGDVRLDYYWARETQHISPEDPNL